MVDKKYKFNFNDEQSVSALLGSLPRIDVPTNFNARVRSRIEQTQTPLRTSWLIPVMSASLCAIVLLVVGIVFIRNSEDQIASRSENISVAAAENLNLQQNTASNESAIRLSNIDEIENAPPVIAKKSSNSTLRTQPQTSPNRGGGSYVAGVRQENPPVVPIGMPTPGSSLETNVRPPSPIVKATAAEVLELIGVDAEFRDSGWHVRKVAANSAAAKSGVLAGDIIELVDNAKLTQNTAFEGGFSGSNLTVLRDGIRKTLSIRHQ